MKDFLDSLSDEDLLEAYDISMAMAYSNILQCEELGIYDKNTATFRFVENIFKITRTVVKERFDDHILNELTRTFKESLDPNKEIYIKKLDELNNLDI